jgi:hypothetical protein
MAASLFNSSNTKALCFLFSMHCCRDKPRSVNYLASRRSSSQMFQAAHFVVLNPGHHWLLGKLHIAQLQEQHYWVRGQMHITFRKKLMIFQNDYTSLSPLSNALSPHILVNTWVICPSNRCHSDGYEVVCITVISRARLLVTLYSCHL